jgi:arylsulfatase A-like enzyme
MWPKKIKPNISTERTHVTDMYATVLDAAQLVDGENLGASPVDGESILPIVIDNKLSERGHIILNVNEFGGAVLDGNWKYIWRSTFPPEEQLFDIGGDASEDINVIAKYPEIATRLKRTLMDASEDMSTSLYLIDLERPSSHETPIIWGDNPTRP